jgi:osmotically inducible protein OsmC
MKKHARVIWHGGIKDGGGTITTETGVLKEAPYGFNARFGDGKGTNPEELVAAAHAACFSMALAGALGEAGLKADEISTLAAVTLEKVAGGYEISQSELRVVAKVPGAGAAQFAGIAEQVKGSCPVSKLLKARITLDATLNP